MRCHWMPIAGKPVNVPFFLQQEAPCYCVCNGSFDITRGYVRSCYECTFINEENHQLKESPVVSEKVMNNWRRDHVACKLKRTVISTS